MLRRDFVVALGLSALWSGTARAADWLQQMDDVGMALRNGEITAEAWAEQMATIAAGLDVDDLLRRTDFDRVAKSMTLPDDRAGVRRIRFPELEASNAGLIVKIFGLKRGRALVPHGHNGIASMFMVVRGEVHGRHYDRVFDQRSHLVVEPTADTVYKPRGTSTATMGHNNVHWFEARSDVAFGFGVALRGLDPDRTSRRVYLDPDGATVEHGGLLRMPILTPRVAFMRYGHRE